MQKKEKSSDELANSNPTARNFQRPNDEEKEQSSPSAQNENGGGEEEEDDEPVLDEEDLEENDLTDEEADNIEWEPEPGKDKQDQGE
jgi:hypothetical protein